MTLTKNLLFAFVILFSTVTFAQNPKAAKYNDKIVDHQHDIAEEMVAFFKSFKTDTKENLEKKRMGLLNKINGSLSKIQAMGGFEGDTKLRDGALDLLKFYKGTVEKEYAEVVHLVTNKNRTKEENDKLDQHRTTLISKEEEMDAKFATIQEEFAKRHNLILKTHELETK
jgi:hypothetical protein